MNNEPISWQIRVAVAAGALVCQTGVLLLWGVPWYLNGFTTAWDLVLLIAAALLSTLGPLSILFSSVPGRWRIAALIVGVPMQVGFLLLGLVAMQACVPVLTAGSALLGLFVLLARPGPVGTPSGFCPNCDYDLAGLEATTCPECGAAVRLASGSRP